MQVMQPWHARYEDGRFLFDRPPEAGAELLVRADVLPNHVPAVEFTNNTLVLAGDDEKLVLPDGSSLDEVRVLTIAEIGVVDTLPAHGVINTEGTLVMPEKHSDGQRTRRLVELLVANRLIQSREEAGRVERQIGGAGLSLIHIFANNGLVQAYIADFADRFGTDYSPRHEPRNFGQWVLSHR